MAQAKLNALATIFGCCLLAHTALAQQPRQINSNDIIGALGYTPASAAQVTNSVLQALSTGTIVAKTSNFYADQGAHIVRFGDRLFIGAGTDNQGDANRDAQPTDWLSATMAPTDVGAWAMWGAQTASLARYGTIGILSASRTSDAVTNAARLGYVPASIGSAAWGIADSTQNPTNVKAWAFYGEAWRMPNVSYQPTIAAEFEGVNLGAPPVGQSNPYHINNGGGVYALQLGCGGGQSLANSQLCDAAITIVPNNQQFQRGIVFASTSLTGTTGATTDYGFASAIEFGANQALQWRTPEIRSGVPGAVYGFMLRSTVKNNLNATRWEATDTGMTIGNTNGQPLFAVYTYINAVSGIHVEPGISNSDGSATVPGALVVDATAADPDLGLFPATAGAGVLSTKATLVAMNVPPPATAQGGFLRIKVNGAPYYIPLFTPSQIGQQ